MYDIDLSGAEQASLHPYLKLVFLYFQMSIDRRLVNQIWGGDSHFMEHHLVPYYYRQILEEREEDAVRFRMGPETATWLKSGLRIRDKWTEDYANFIIDNDGTPTCHVICAGTNNLRDDPSTENKNYIVKLFEFLIDIVLLTEHAALCVISPLPEGEGKIDDIGEELDQDLRKLCEEKGAETGAIKYINFRSKKCPHHGRPTRFDPRLFKRDLVHLSPAGAKMMAHYLFQTQTNIPNTVFGMPQKDEVSLPKRIRITTGMSLREFDEDLDRKLKYHRAQSDRDRERVSKLGREQRQPDHNGN